MRLFFILLAAVLVFSAPAMAQSKKGLTGNISQDIGSAEIDLLQRLAADAKVAFEDAKTHNDTIAEGCYAAIAQVADVKIAAAQVAGGGLLLAFQKIRDIARLNASPVGTQLIIGCAPLVQDARINMIQFFTQIGGTVLLKGFLIP